MSEIVYRFYGLLHRAAKSLIGKRRLPSPARRGRCIRIGVPKEKAPNHWRGFVEGSLIKTPDFNGFHFAGYIADCMEWCLPSWIWTNAASVRMYCSIGEIQKARLLCDRLIAYQQGCGGWIVRNDYDSIGAIPVLAPNDSAYIANNAVLSVYEATREKEYLDVAIKCANWIIETARPDGILHTGYNVRDGKWETDNVIVDIGFAAGLFAHLTELTGDDRYRLFLERFVARYIELFYIKEKDGFCTSVDKNNNRQGGMFARGQAWALEGLIPAYNLIQTAELRYVIDRTVRNLIRQQNRNGGWAYNLTRKLMGEDCKAVSVIAKDLMDWFAQTGDEQIRDSAEKAYDWCCAHTAFEGPGRGGIFSYCTEGAIVKDLYTSCAFVYASAYAIELEKQLKR